MKKYIKYYLKTLFFWSFVSSTALFIIFFLVLVLCETAVYPPVTAFNVYFLVVAFLLFGALSCLRFQSIIKHQERLLHISFSDSNAAPLYKGSIVFLSDEWLIVAGRTAFCKDYIKRISIVAEKTTNKVNGYRIKVLTVEGRFRSFDIDSSSSARKIVTWYKMAKNNGVSQSRIK